MQNSPIWVGFLLSGSMHGALETVHWSIVPFQLQNKQNKIDYHSAGYVFAFIVLQNKGSNDIAKVQAIVPFVL